MTVDPEGFIFKKTIGTFPDYACVKCCVGMNAGRPLSKRRTMIGPASMYEKY